MSYDRKKYVIILTRRTCGGDGRWTTTEKIVGETYAYTAAQAVNNYCFRTNQNVNGRSGSGYEEFFGAKKVKE